MTSNLNHEICLVDTIGNTNNHDGNKSEHCVTIMMDNQLHQYGMDDNDPCLYVYF